MRHIALTIKQPYASRILKGSKKIEYRSWQTHHRGDIVICASKSPKVNGLPTGCLICLAELYKISGNPDSGDYNWHLRNIRPLKQRPVKGQCRLFYVDILKGDVLDKPLPCLRTASPPASLEEKNQDPIEMLRNTVKGLFVKQRRKRK